jgi:hypothetical protein
LFLLASVEAGLPARVPVLRQITTHHFVAPYSCIQGYNGTALFLTQESLDRGEPELLYYGNCLPAEPTFYMAYAGSGIGYATDIGAKPLFGMSANDAHWSSGFNGDPAVIEGHTYVAFVAEDHRRFFLAVNVKSLNNQTGAMVLDCGVFLYERFETTVESPGFDWSKGLQA